MSNHHDYGVEVDGLQVHRRPRFTFGGRTKTHFTNSPGLTCHIPAGSITGLFGLNGVGKSTFLRAMAGRIPITGGQLTFTHAPAGAALSDLAPMLVGDPNEVPDLHVGDTPQFHQAFRPRWNQTLFDALVEEFEIPTDTDFKKLSRGQQSLTMAALGLASGEGLIAFDEVTSGVDQEARVKFTEVLLHRHERTQATYVLSSHLVDELDGIVDHTIVLTHGEVRFCGSPDNLREQFMTIHADQGAVSKLAESILPPLKLVETNDPGLVVTVPDGHVREKLAQATKAQGFATEWPTLAQASVYITEPKKPLGR